MAYRGPVYGPGPRGVLLTLKVDDNKDTDTDDCY